MQIITPSQITAVAWEGALVAPATTRAFKSPSAKPPVVTVGQPEVWRAADALENQVGQKWIAPIGGAEYWLARFACTLRKPAGLETISVAQQTLSLRPKNPGADQRTAYAFGLFPDRLGAADQTELSVKLSPELKFADGSGFKAGELGAKIEFKKVFPIIQSYGAGESAPYWIFRPHSSYPLEGSQFVYAVLVAKAGADGLRGSVEVTVTVETQFGPIKFGTPEEAQAHTLFVIP